MTDQTSPATSLPVVATMRKGCTAADNTMHNVHFEPSDHPNWINLTPRDPAQATINVLRAEVERLRGTLTMLRNHTAVSENQMLMIDDALHRLTDSALPGTTDADVQA